jgi:hypothetical protein
MSLAAQVALSIVAHENSSEDIARQTRVTPASYALLVGNGTGANQAQVAWSDSRTLAGSSETLTLSGLADTRDGVTVTVNLTAVKAIYVKNTHATLPLTVSPAGLATNSKYVVCPGGACVHITPSAAGDAYTSIAVAGTAGGTYDIVLVGNGSVS